MLEWLAIAVFTIWAWSRLRKDLVTGLCLAVSLMVCLPTYLRITLPPPLPALTIHRLILILLLMYWARNPDRMDVSAAALKKSFLFWAVVSGLSMAFTTIGFVTSLKDYLDYVFEIFFFFLIVCTTIRDRDSAVRLIKAVWWGMMVVAVFAVIEKYTRFNPVDRFISGYDRGKGYNDVVSTLPQRIMLGTAMAMAWPLAYALGVVNKSLTKRSRLTLWVSAILFLSACYFSMSRGPWLAAVVAGLVLAALGSGIVRKRLAIVGVAAALVLVARPGVVGTLTGMAEMTSDVDSQKGGTFRYRLELWKIAWSQVSKSPLRMLVGNGLGAGRETELSVALSYRDKDFVVDSWDNHFAYDLFQTGLLGLSASLLLHVGAALFLFQLWRKSRPPERDVLACCLASMAALLFMMTNVLIFAKQLNFAFWCTFAAGVVCGREFSIMPTELDKERKETYSDQGSSLDDQGSPWPEEAQMG